METEFLTATEAALQLGISKERMACYCRQGRLSHVTRKGKIWFIPKSELEKFRRARQHYKVGRPARHAFPSVFWRERKRPHEDEVLHILLNRAPDLIPKMIQRSVVNRYIRDGRTRLERIVRKHLIQGLYEHS